MSVHIEDLRPGDWITGYVDKTDGAMPPMRFDGMPWKVVAVSAPFIACHADGHFVTIDIRQYGVTKLSKKYVNAVRRFKFDPEPQPAEKAVDPRACPRCGERLIQRFCDHDSLWHVVCPICRLDKGPAEEGAMP